MMKKSLKDIAKTIGEDERAHAERQRSAEDERHRSQEEEAAAQAAFDTWKSAFGPLANKALEDICDELVRSGVSATLHAYQLQSDDSALAREEFAQQTLTWLCWVSVSQSITPRNKHKADPLRLGQKRIVTTIGFIVPDGVRRVLPLARRKQGEYGQFGAPIFSEDPLPTADALRELIEPLFVKALDE